MMPTHEQPESPVALIVGSCTTPEEIRAAAATSDRLVFYELKDALVVDKDLARVGDIVDRSGDVPEIESLAWSWADGLIGHLRSRASSLDADALHVCRRAMFMNVFVGLAI